MEGFFSIINMTYISGTKKYEKLDFSKIKDYETINKSAKNQHSSFSNERDMGVSKHPPKNKYSRRAP